ncbi:hypothetical protein V8C86DRAFT_3162109, partial [Haematococcus lacustris]
MEGVPALNRFVLRAGGKGPEVRLSDCRATLAVLEGIAFLRLHAEYLCGLCCRAECVPESAKQELCYMHDLSSHIAVGALALADEKQRDGLEKQMCRLAQHGALTLGTVELALGVLPKGSRGDKGDRLLARFVLYLVQLALGDGSAGTPVPQPAGRAALQPHCPPGLAGSAPSPPRAVDALGPEQLCPAWSALGGEEAVPFLRKQAALRALAALASAARTSRPDQHTPIHNDPTYPDGLYSTLTSLLARLRELRASRSSLGSLLAAQRAAEGSALARQKHAGQEFKKVMEQWGLMRLAFSAARCALSPPASLQVAASCFAGVSSPDSLGARHALALAALASLEPQAVMVVVAELGPRLAHNLALARITAPPLQAAWAPLPAQALGPSPPAPPAPSYPLLPPLHHDCCTQMVKGRSISGR